MRNARTTAIGPYQMELLALVKRAEELLTVDEKNPRSPLFASNTTEASESTEKSENTEDSETTESSEDTESKEGNTDNTETSESTEGSESTENSETSEDSETTENSEDTEDKEEITDAVTAPLDQELTPYILTGNFDFARFTTRVERFRAERRQRQS